MNPTKQTILHDPDNGKFGNCLSAVLASVLHLPIADIPTFSDTDTWTHELNAWLRPFNLAYISFDGKGDWQKSFGIEGLYHEIAGPSLRHAETSHACVGLDCKVEFDPHPDNTGLATVDSCGVLIVLQPWKMLELQGLRFTQVPYDEDTDEEER